jgi:hypothetical protein
MPKVSAAKRKRLNSWPSKEKLDRKATKQEDTRIAVKQRSKTLETVSSIASSKKQLKKQQKKKKKKLLESEMAATNVLKKDEEF